MPDCSEQISREFFLFSFYSYFETQLAGINPGDKLRVKYGKSKHHLCTVLEVIDLGNGLRRVYFD